MKGTPFANPPGLYIEIGQTSLKALHGEEGLDLPLERLENGRLTPLCLEKLTVSLRLFLKKHSWRASRPVFCALGARGVSLRRLTLPAGSEEETQRLLPLQIEREFPLPPEELAWGYYQLHQESPANQELLVVAVKKEVLQEYSAVLSECDVPPVFTLAALARSALCPQLPKSFAVLDVGRSQSELLSFENGAPKSIRVLPWGEENILASSLQLEWIGQRLYLSGGSTHLPDLLPQLAKAINGSSECVRLETTTGEGRSAAILGMKQWCEAPGASPLLILQNTNGQTQTKAPPTSWKWAALAGLLIVCAIALRYAGALFLKPSLARKISEMKAYRAKLPDLERELNFLQYLKTNQPPYLDPLYALATSAPSGMRIETLSMNGRGDLSLRGVMRESQQVVDFRSKLIDSGLFSSVVVEEQTPSPDRQKLVVRMTGHWKFGTERKAAGSETALPASEPKRMPNGNSELTNAKPPVTKELTTHP